MASMRNAGAAGRILLVLMLVCCAGPVSAYTRAADEDRSAAARDMIEAVLDDFHDAAAAADAERYLGHLTADAVFMGTDDWERWPLPVFRDYVEKRFADGGWVYTPRTRNVAVDGQIAWFDEIVESARWGQFRGTGVLRRVDGKWKIAHYALSFLIPNERWESVSRSAREGFAERQRDRETP